MKSPIARLIEKREEIQNKSIPGPYFYDIGNNEIESHSRRSWRDRICGLDGTANDLTVGKFIVEACNTIQARDEIIEVLLNGLDKIQERMCDAECDLIAVDCFNKADAIASKALGEENGA